MTNPLWVTRMTKRICRNLKIKFSNKRGGESPLLSYVKHRGKDLIMELKIGNKTYNIEFSVEASLCDDCVEAVTNFMLTTSNAQGLDAVKYVIGNMTNLPGTALSMFYGGLVAHHGEDGDGSVTCKADAKALLKQYIVDHKEDGKANYYDIIGMLIGQMEKDGFFDLIGLTKMFQTAESKVKKMPTDHKKKQKKEVTDN